MLFINSAEASPPTLDRWLAAVSMAAYLRHEQGGAEHIGLGTRPTNKKRLSSSGLGATSSPRYNLVGRKEYSYLSETDIATGL